MFEHHNRRVKSLIGKSYTETTYKGFDGKDWIKMVRKKTGKPITQKHYGKVVKKKISDHVNNLAQSEMENDNISANC